jgi:hypothetical protein
MVTPAVGPIKTFQENYDIKIERVIFITILNARNNPASK